MVERSVTGCLLGTAVGDALGLPYEKVSPARAARLLGPPDRYRFLFRYGMISDDTEHTCMVAQSLIESGGDVAVFEKRFSRRLRWWALGGPAGTGKATLIAAMRLWLGFGPSKSGVFSAGNGPAMRAPIFGASIDDRELMLRMLKASTRMTHRDPKAEYGAIAIAIAARHARQRDCPDAQAWLGDVRDCLGGQGGELLELLERAVASADRGEDCFAFAESLGLSGGVSGYTCHTVPVAVHVWLSHFDDLRGAVTASILLGGDAGTTAAIVGGIVGAGVGVEGVPDDLLCGIKDLPRSVAWMQRLGRSLAESSAAAVSTQATGLSRSVAAGDLRKPPGVNPVVVIVRNALFLFVVLVHGFRRLGPPY